MSQSSPFKAGDTVFCYHGPLLYEARILSLKLEKDNTTQKLYLHYNGWSKKWDEWVSESRVFRINDETLQKKRELESAHKKADRMKALKRLSGKVDDKKKKSQTQQNASQQNGLNPKSTCSTKRKRSSASGLNPKSTCSTKRKRSSTSESDIELENSDEDYENSEEDYNNSDEDYKNSDEDYKNSDKDYENSENEDSEDSENSKNENFTKVWKGCQALNSENEVMREPGVPFEPCPECNERQIVEAFQYKRIYRKARQKTMPSTDIIIWFKRLQDLGFQLTAIPNISNENLKCEVCHRLYPDKESLKAHMKRHPLLRSDRRHKCQKCPYSSDHLNTVRMHQLTHDLPTFACPICNRMFKVPMNLRKHVTAIHSGEKPFECPTCSKTFSRATHLHIHQKSVHWSGKLFKCLHCEKTFTTCDYRNRHEKVHSDEKFECPHCSSVYANAYNLKRHIICMHTHDYPQKCDECGKGFVTPKEVRVHMKDNHWNNKND